MPRGVVVLAGICLALALASGCGGDDSTTTRQAEAQRPAVVRQRVDPSICPSGHPACRTAEGRIVFVQAVDPDGDGDAHFVIADPQGISLPLLTSIDVRRGLRPHPLPRVGDLISAAGPVQTGSFGQSQIHAIEIHVAGRSG